VRPAEDFLAELTEAAAGLVERHPEVLRRLYREAPGTFVDAGSLPGAPAFGAEVRLAWLPCPAAPSDPGAGWAILLFYVPVLHAMAQVALHHRSLLSS
jgi:hypothetical protein